MLSIYESALIRTYDLFYIFKENKNKNIMEPILFILNTVNNNSQFIK